MECAPAQPRGYGPRLYTTRSFSSGAPRRWHFSLPVSHRPIVMPVAQDLLLRKGMPGRFVFIDLDPQTWPLVGQGMAVHEPGRGDHGISPGDVGPDCLLDEEVGRDQGEVDAGG